MINVDIARAYVGMMMLAASVGIYTHSMVNFYLVLLSVCGATWIVASFGAWVNGR